MNVLAGLVIGVLTNSWTIAGQYSIIWAIIHVLYGGLFGLHRNIVTESAKAGNPVLSYFIARFFTALITSIIFASATIFLLSFFRD